MTTSEMLLYVSVHVSPTVPQKKRDGHLPRCYKIVLDDFLHHNSILWPTFQATHRLWIRCATGKHLVPCVVRSHAISIWWKQVGLWPTMITLLILVMQSWKKRTLETMYSNRTWTYRQNYLETYNFQNHTWIDYRIIFVFKCSFIWTSCIEKIWSFRIPFITDNFWSWNFNKNIFSKGS